MGDDKPPVLLSLDGRTFGVHPRPKPPQWMGCCELHNCILLLLPFELDLLYAFFSWVTEFFSATMSQATNKEKASSPYSWKKCKKFWGELWTPAESPPWHQECTHQCYAEAPGGLCCFLLYYSSSSTTTANVTQNQQFLSSKEAELGVVLSLVLVLLLVTEYECWGTTISSSSLVKHLLSMYFMIFLSSTVHGKCRVSGE